MITPGDAADLTKTIKDANPDSNLILRQGVVISVETATSITINLGSATNIPDVKSLIVASVGDTVWVLENGPDLLVLGSLGAGGLPSGMIVMWSGTIATVPIGWALCNGTNGTPNLTNRFVVGAGSTYNPGAVGGSANATLPSHSHATDSSGRRLVHADSPTDQSAGLQVGGASYGLTGGFTTGSAGSSATNANLPPYYALAYIMKL